MRVIGARAIRTQNEVFGSDITVIDMEDEEKMALWEEFGGTDVDACYQHMGNLFIRYATDHTTTGVREYTSDAFEKLLGTKMLLFVQGCSCSRQNVITISKELRIGLTYKFGDKHSYDGPEIENKDWVLNYVWLSDGTYGQKKVRYYAYSVDDSTVHLIELYTYEKWGGLNKASKIDRDEEGVASFFQET